MPVTEVRSHELGLTALVQNEVMQRAWHALVDDGRVWLVDPLDDPAAMEAATELGEPAAVLQLLDRHNRDCAEIAAHLKVPHLRVPDSAPGSPFSAIPVVRLPLWKETALWWPERSALIVAEAVGSGPIYAVGDEPVGVHPFLRLKPPGVLRGRRASHLLFGHGPPVHGPEASRRLEGAYERARLDIPALLRALPSLR